MRRPAGQNRAFEGRKMLAFYIAPYRLLRRRLLLDVVAVFGFALYFDFKGQEDALSNGTILILTLLNYICFYAITVRRSEQS